MINEVREAIAKMTNKEYIKLDVFKDEDDFLIITTMNTEPNYELYYEISPHHVRVKRA